MPKTISIAGSDDPVSITLCLNGEGALTCQKYTLANNTANNYAYMANIVASSISVCTVDTDGSLQNCIDQTDPTFSSPGDIILNHQANKAYVLNKENSTISICSLAANGLLSACTSVNPGPFALEYGGLSLSNNYLYFTSYLTQRVGICSITPNGSLNVPCSSSSADTLIDCSSYANAAFTGPIGASVNVAGTILYVANDDTAAICPLNPDGSIVSCTSSTGDGTFNFDETVANLFISTNLAYIPNIGDSGSISIFPLLPDGTFDTYTLKTDSTFNHVASVWLSLG